MMTGEFALNIPFFSALGAPASTTLDSVRGLYKSHSARVYSLAFLMTGNELEAEQVTECVFLRLCTSGREFSSDQVEQTLITELRAYGPLGVLTLACVEEALPAVRVGAKRSQLESAVSQVPATERLIYLLHDAVGDSAERIAALLGMKRAEVLQGLHQARLRIRELLSYAMQG